MFELSCNSLKSFSLRRIVKIKFIFMDLVFRRYLDARCVFEDSKY